MLLTAWFALANGFQPLAVVLAAAAVHELGHYLVLTACGAQISGLRLSALTASGCLMEKNWRPFWRGRGQICSAR